MASVSGASSGSRSSDEDLQQIMDQRKRKRMISNRESARRSRMRKQKQLDDLTAQVAQIRKENEQIIVNINYTTQLYLNLDGENSILRAQMSELRQRLDSLEEIVGFVIGEEDEGRAAIDGLFDCWRFGFVNQRMMVAGDLLMG